MAWMASTAALSGLLGFCIAASGKDVTQPLTGASLADLSLEELGAIEVTSVSKRAQPLSDAAAAVYVITADDIRRSGVTSLPEALRLAPNLQVAKINNGRYAITARGFNGPEANKLLVLIDGRSVYTPLFAGVFWDSQHVMLEDVARIEVVSGPGGTLWGVNAVNGVINVITRPASETQGNLISAGVGNQGAQVAARHGGRWDDGSGGFTAYRLYAQRFNENETDNASGAGTDDGWQVAQAGFRADHGAGRDQFSVHGDVYHSDQGQSPPGAFYIRGVPLDLQHMRVQGANLAGRWARRLGEQEEVSVQAYFDRAERLVPTSFQQRLDIGDVQLQYTAPITATQAFVIGGEYRIAHDKLANMPMLEFHPGTSTQSWSSVFAQDDITLTPKVHLVAGSRWETNEYSGTEWLPNLRLSYKPADNHMLWSALSKTVRSPSRLDREAYIAWPGTYLQWDTAHLGPQRPYLLAGGPTVRSELAHVFEIGYRGQPMPLSSLSVNVFRALYDRLHTEEILQGTQGLLTFAGNMKGAVSGIEAWASYQPMETWRLSGGFTGLYQRFRLVEGSNDVNNLPKANGRDPAQTWQIRSSWDLPGRHEIDATFRHVSRLRDPDVPAYSALDLRWGWQALPKLRVSLTGRNLLGGHGEYNEQATRSELGRGLYAQATFIF